MDICLSWSDNYCLFLLLIGYSALRVYFPLSKFIDPLLGSLEPKDEVWVVVIPVVAKFLLLSAEFRLFLLN